MSRLRWLLILLVIVSVVAAPATAARGRPELSLFTPDARFAPGEEATLDLYIQNGGTIDLGSTAAGVNDRLTTARDVRVEIDDAGPIDVETTEKPVGQVPEGVTGPVGFDITIAENAKPGTYELDYEVNYKYTNQIAFNDPDSPVHNQREATETGELTIRIDREARFRVANASLGTLVDDRGPLRLTVRNVGSAVATDARLTINSHDDRLTFDGRSSANRFVGTWSADETRTLTFESTVADGAEREPLPVSFDVDYVDTEGDDQTSDTRTTGVTYAARSDRFTIEDVTTAAPIGDSGTVTMTVRNIGSDPVDEVRFGVESTDARLTFGDRPTAETFVGRWAPGEVKRISFTATVASGSDVRAYPIIGTVTYQAADDETRQTDPLVTGLVPLPEQEFAVRDLQSTLSVGQEGQVRGSIVNVGEIAIRNAVVVFETDNPNVNPIETEYQIGSLDSGASADFVFDVEITESAGSGPRQFSVHVRYRDPQDEVRRSDPLDLNVSVGPKADVFTIEPVEGTLQAGGSGAIELRVTNQGDEALTDISAKVFADDPLSSDDDEAFIAALGPGESTTITFGVSAGGSALEKVYPISMDFQYDEPDGDTRLSDTYMVPIEVTTQSGGGGPPIGLIVGVVVLVVLVAGGVYFYRRRQRNTL